MKKIILLPLIILISINLFGQTKTWPLCLDEDGNAIANCEPVSDDNGIWHEAVKDTSYCIGTTKYIVYQLVNSTDSIIQECPGECQDAYLVGSGNDIFTVGDSIYEVDIDTVQFSNGTINIITDTIIQWVVTDTSATGLITSTQYISDQDGSINEEYTFCKQADPEITVNTENVDSTRMNCDPFTIDLADFTQECEDQFGNSLPTIYSITSIPTADALVLLSGSVATIIPDEATCSVATDIIFNYQALCQDGTVSQSLITIDFPSCELACGPDQYVNVLGNTTIYRPSENDDLVCTDGTVPSIVIQSLTPTVPPSIVEVLPDGYIAFTGGAPGEIQVEYSVACGGIACDQQCLITFNVVAGSPLNDEWFTPNDQTLSGNSVIDDVTCSDQDPANYSWIDANGNPTLTPPALVFGTITGTPGNWLYTPQLGNCSQQAVPYIGPCGVAYIILNTSGCIIVTNDSNECKAIPPANPECTENIGVNDVCVNATQNWVLTDCNGIDINFFPHPLYECAPDGCIGSCTVLADAQILSFTNGFIEVQYNGNAYVNGQISGCINYRLECLDPQGNVLESEVGCSEHIFTVPPPEIDLKHKIDGTWAEGEISTLTVEVCNPSPTNDIVSGADQFNYLSPPSNLNGTIPTTWTFVSSTSGSPAGALVVGECAIYTAPYTLVAADINQDSIICSLEVTGVDSYGQSVTDISDDNGDGVENNSSGPNDLVGTDNGEDDQSVFGAAPLPPCPSNQQKEIRYNYAGCVPNEDLIQTNDIECIGGACNQITSNHSGNIVVNQVGTLDGCTEFIALRASNGGGILNWMENDNPNNCPPCVPHSSWIDFTYTEFGVASCDYPIEQINWAKVRGFQFDIIITLDAPTSDLDGDGNPDAPIGDNATDNSCMVWTTNDGGLTWYGENNAGSQGCTGQISGMTLQGPFTTIRIDQVGDSEDGTKSDTWNLFHRSYITTCSTCF